MRACVPTDDDVCRRSCEVNKIICICRSPSYTSQLRSRARLRPLKINRRTLHEHNTAHGAVFIKFIMWPRGAGGRTHESRSDACTVSSQVNIRMIAIAEPAHLQHTHFNALKPVSNHLRVRKHQHNNEKKRKENTHTHAGANDMSHIPGIMFTRCVFGACERARAFAGLAIKTSYAGFPLGVVPATAAATTTMSLR